MSFRRLLTPALALVLTAALTPTAAAQSTADDSSAVGQSTAAAPRQQLQQEEDPEQKAPCPEPDPTYVSTCGPVFTQPQWSDSGGWDDPSKYETIQTADLDGDGLAELLGRSATGLSVFTWDPTLGQWTYTIGPSGGPALIMRDAEGWVFPEQYGTIQTADIDNRGADELLARFPDGLRAFRWNAGTGEFEQLGAAFDVLADGPDADFVATTIQSGFRFADGSVGLIFQTSDGLATYSWDRDNLVWAPKASLQEDFVAVGTEPSHVDTIQTADVDGDGSDEVLARFPDGLRTYFYSEQTELWTTRTPPLARMDDSSNFGESPYYDTIQTGDIDGDGKADLIGLLTATSVLQWRWTSSGWTAIELIESNDWVQNSHALTIQTADLDGNGRDELISRFGSGIFAWRYDPDTGWSTFGPGRPLIELSDPVWNDPGKYLTIQTADLDGDERAELLARGTFGVRTFAWSEMTPAFVRPRPYSNFPTYNGDEAAAYREVNEILDIPDIIAVFTDGASPPRQATLLEYFDTLARNCTPAPPDPPNPPSYSTCTPPAGSGVNPTAFTTVTNDVSAWLWAGQGVAQHHDDLHETLTTLFLNEQGTFPAIDGDFKIDGGVDKPAVPEYLALFDGVVDVVNDIVQLIPEDEIAKDVVDAVRIVATTADALGAVADGLGLAPAQPDTPPKAYEDVTTQLATYQQNTGDLIDAQRNYVLADPGLLMAVGSAVQTRALLIDQTAMLSSGRQRFNEWVYQTYLPVFWAQYEVSPCETSVAHGWYCSPPAAGPYVSGGSGDGAFTAVLGNGSTCTGHLFVEHCSWDVPTGELQNLIWDAVSESCTYDLTKPGTADVWRYGCSLGVPPGGALNDQDGWNLPVMTCSTQDTLPGSHCSVTTLDEDADGVPDPVETSAPNAGDGNDDGIPDRHQPDVASLLAFDVIDHVTFVASEGSVFEHVGIVPPLDDPAPTQPPPATIELPLGNFGFEVTADPDATVTILLPSSFEPDSFYRFGATGQDPPLDWFEFLSDGTTGAIIDGDEISVNVRDGARGDADGLTDGVVASGGAPSVPTAVFGRDVAFVSSRSTPTLADRPLVNRLKARGAIVTVVDDDDLRHVGDDIDPTATDLIVVSRWASAHKIGDTLTAAAIPVVTWEPDLYDDLGMTGRSRADRGTTRQRHEQITITDADSPLAGGLPEGPTSITRWPTRVSFGKPAEGAMVAVTVDDGAAVFGYDTGDTMVAIAAPAPRVGLPFDALAPLHLTEDGWALYDAAADWAIGDDR